MSAEYDGYFVSIDSRSPEETTLKNTLLSPTYKLKVSVSTLVSAILALYLLGIGWIPNFAESYSTGNLDVITAVLPVSKPVRK